MCHAVHSARAHLECRTIRNTNGKIGKRGQGLVGEDPFEGKVVGDLMNSEEEVVVRRSAYGVRVEDELQGEGMRMTQHNCDRKLQYNHGEYDPFCQRFMSHQFRNLHMRGECQCEVHVFLLGGHVLRDVPS